ncbi:MAG TPA: hypothetical protein DEW74_02905 [Opitutae bacterium]|nr:hypothetical protein [Opitutae bacterium]
MSKCCLCEQAASVHLINVDANGRMFETFLCAEHAENKEVSTPNAYQLMDILPHYDKGVVLSNHICPTCGCTKEWIESTHYAGCPDCYKTFKELRLTGAHDCCIHFGKIPQRKLSPEAFKPRLRYLQAQLQAAIDADRLEAAQQIQKQIRTIEKAIKACTQ